LPDLDHGWDLPLLFIRIILPTGGSISVGDVVAESDAAAAKYCSGIDILDEGECGWE